jgi:uncharacterized damage-inducible protein DinB
MDASTIQELYRFNTWANENVRDALDAVDDATMRRPLDLFFGSVYDILDHLYRAEQMWLDRLRSADPAGPLQIPEPAGGPRDLLARWRAADAEWEAFVGGLTPADLERPTGWGPGMPVFTFWQAVLQVPLHNSEHRAHATTGMTVLGIAHGPQDFLIQFVTPEFLAEMQARRAAAQAGG